MSADTLRPTLGGWGYVRPDSTRLTGVEERDHDDGVCADERAIEAHDLEHRGKSHKEDCKDSRGVDELRTERTLATASRMPDAGCRIPRPSRSG
jgi:hypothetical protein